MSDKTFNFMMYLKMYRPKVHDHLITMVYLGVSPGRDMVKKIFHTYADICKFPKSWNVNEINVFQLRVDLISGKWESKTWGKLMQYEAESKTS